MRRTSQLIAVLALGAAGAAFAQGNPPTTAPANPATAAGQQSQTGTPMGTTGTLPQNNTAGTTSSGSTTTSQSSGSMNSGTNMAAAEPMRPARADRN
ncbi:hypothetical protein M2165_000264 [Variovorax sp. TBS-050B]|uniref:proteophosphoglycan ppg4 n=1 Tax=Variovorax sp. TBS-050B TaxID=2940551 RepID=UPI002472FBBE|nr:proteophosphoglycan ppg4 [Variovorax sp. TBS-050B]MDH6590375.1 hypothetical protein [Variovorax sp. TBS-050B]